MNFMQFVEGSGIAPEAIRYYVDEKLIKPLFPEGPGAEKGEYAEEDLYRLRIIANLRRLRLSTEDIRRIVYDPAKSAAVMLRHFERLNAETKASVSCIYAMEDIDLASFSSPDEILGFFHDLDLDLPLPDRDLNRDPEFKNRELLEEKLGQNETMHRQLVQLERAHRRSNALMLLFLFLFLICVGFIVAPYILW